MVDRVALSGGCSEGHRLVGVQGCGFLWGAFFDVSYDACLLSCFVDSLFCVGAEELSFAGWLGQGCCGARGGYCNFFGDIFGSAFLDR